MGRSRNKRVLKRDFKTSREDKWDESSKNRTGGYDAHELTNGAFEEYYKLQQIVPEGEWDAFMAALRDPLPTVFRINGSGRFAADLRDRLDRDFLSQFGGEPIYVSGERLDPPEALAWYPDKLAWQFPFSRAQLRKLPMLEAIHELVKREDAAGSITRQEAVSMIPPLFLDVQPHHRVLDTCAAPGSKTAQVLEMLHQGVQLPSGCVVANDVEAQRCNLLTHQVKRICSPALVVTNHDASQFPLVSPKGTSKGQEARYDRVLCDVPCSGDGTLRKSPDIWRRWTAHNGNGLHFLQSRIALRACHLLKVGGRLVYSTCTFNPIEDEAVVAHMLRQTHGSMELLDVSTELPALKRMQGLHTWQVRDKAKFRSTFSEDAVGKVAPSMYPDEEAASPLERCMRVLPHHNDSGGFFIAVLRKVADISVSPAAQGHHAKPRIVESADPQQLQEASEAPRSSVPAPAAAPEPNERTQAQKTDQPNAGGQDTSKFANILSNQEGNQASTSAQPATEAAEKGAASLQTDSRPQPLVPPAEATSLTAPADLGLGVRADNPPQRSQDGQVQPPNIESTAPGTQTAAPQLATASSTDAILANGTAASTAAAAPATGEGAQSSAQVAAEAIDHAMPDAHTVEQPSNSNAAVPEAAPKPANPQWGPRGGGSRGREGGGGKWRGIDPVVPFTDEACLRSMTDFYGFPPSCHIEQQLISRTPQSDATRPKRLYYVSAGVKALLLEDENEQLKVTATGLKTFERQETKDGRSQCAYRVAQEGVPIILPYLTKQILRPSLEEFLALLTHRTLSLPPHLQTHVDGSNSSPQANGNTVSTPASSPADAAAEAANGTGDDEDQEHKAKKVKVNSEGVEPADGIKTESIKTQDATTEGGQQKDANDPAVKPKPTLTDAETLTQLPHIANGCCIVTLRPGEAQRLGVRGALSADPAPGGTSTLAVVCWRGRGTLSILVSKAECQLMLETLQAASAGGHALPGLKAGPKAEAGAGAGPAPADAMVS